MIPEAAVEAAAEALFPHVPDPSEFKGDFWLTAINTILEAALPHIQAQALDEAVDAFPLETIHAPDNAVVWMHRRAQEIRGRI